MMFSCWYVVWLTQEQRCGAAPLSLYLLLWVFFSPSLSILRCALLPLQGRVATELYHLTLNELTVDWWISETLRWLCHPFQLYANQPLLYFKSSDISFFHGSHQQMFAEYQNQRVFFNIYLYKYINHRRSNLVSLDSKLARFCWWDEELTDFYKPTHLIFELSFQHRVIIKLYFVLWSSV